MLLYLKVVLFGLIIGFFVFSFFLFILGIIIRDFDERRIDRMRSFECGFVSITSSKNTFSVQFFLVAIIFLVFDVEIAILLPFPLILVGNVGLRVVILLFMVLVLVLFGLYYEW